MALVGYTNAGKSTLLNTLSGADVLAEDKLFATLDPVVRTVKTPAGGEFLLVDTVGFISKLPHALVDAFHSTLEEALLADVLLIVSDGASGEMIRQHDVVLEVLSSLGAADKPMIDVINKADLPGVTANEWPGRDCNQRQEGRRAGRTAGSHSSQTARRGKADARGDSLCAGRPAGENTR